MNAKTLISIHAPRAGRDWSKAREIDATPISIHAPRAGRDKTVCIEYKTNGDFNPRAPRGARRRLGKIAS